MLCAEVHLSLRLMGRCSQAARYIPLKIESENGPSFISSALASPNMERVVRFSTKAFVSKKLKHNICEQGKPKLIK
jgi:hypothetical protein